MSGNGAQHDLQETALIGLRYAATELHARSAEMDRIFKPYHSTESEELRRKTFEGHSDPRTNLLNFLGWD